MAPAKPPQNNPAPVTEEEAGKERESKGRPERREGGGSFKSGEFQFWKVISGYASVPLFFSFLFVLPEVLIQIV